MISNSIQKASNDYRYHGRILNGDYSQMLQGRILECINAFQLIEKTGTPAMLYIAAWQEDEKQIWYEYVCHKITSILGCEPGETAGAFCRSVIESRIYKYGVKHENDDTTIRKEQIPQNALNCEREHLRSESVSAGVTEAVYKMSLQNRGEIWLNDKANIEWYQEDGIYVSLGSLTDVTKEMTAEEEREKLLVQLQDALAKVKMLSGLIPICANCKQIRDDQGYWNQIEAYISRHSDAQFSHGICPDCARKLYPDFFKSKNKKS
ncbi:hypothetical protein MTBBW1_340053 [Desulfamplus magnetovallimortis]|uniref:PAC domain-containing protein n=1 Tax=Desulfamplus magnetovallimortis TaxID=1246637 RepID=A0A1W1HG66_9BACT|nr:hypothetical protein [Desulfamplus magnetovallimortis]SLM31501.1 hypothetical protein MTBBW1_340053 [Desulfamplus magnetovallimortis]